ncbi:TetR/AcrR family transcriptional regulator [Desulfocurvus sp. DL9XJH121]
MAEKDTKGTKERILEAASDVFAEQGFEKGTVREICARAKANVAAVNYHFRDKQELYVVVLDAWRLESSAKFPLDGGLPPDAPLAERLTAFYAAVLKRIFMCGRDFEEARRRGQVIMQELASGRFRIGRDRDEAYCEMKETMTALLAEVMEFAPKELIQASVSSCLSQLTTYFVGYVAEFDENTLSSVRDIEQVAAHMTVFAMGGVRGILEAAGLDVPAAAFARVPTPCGNLQAGL